MTQKLTLTVLRTCVVCGGEEEFMCDRCKQAVCRVCVRYRGEQILCPPCDDNNED